MHKHAFLLLAEDGEAGGTFEFTPYSKSNALIRSLFGDVVQSRMKTMEVDSLAVPSRYRGQLGRKAAVPEQAEGPVPGNGGRFLHESFEQQALLRPDHVALSLAGAELTYGQLDRAADRLAADLIERGVGPESMVGLFLDRSFELIVALLAVWKAGGAYVPLDPEYPRARLKYVLGDT